MYLNCKTYYSYLYGTFSTEGLVKAAVEAGARAVALTNINSTADIWPFVQLCKKEGIKPIAGVEIRNADALCYVLLARNLTGVFEINRFLSAHLVAGTAFPARYCAIDSNVIVIYPLMLELLDKLDVNEFIGVQPTEVNKLILADLTRYGHKLVMRHPVTFQNNTYYNVHRLLRAIDKNILLSKQQGEHLAGKHETFIDAGALMQCFVQVPEIISNTIELVNSCSVSMDFATDKNKRYYTANKAGDRKLLEKLALDGLLYRYGPHNKEAQERVAKELAIIDQLNFNFYFLATWDFLQYAKNRGFFHVGRGSGANSIVAYCLQITDVDPVELDLYFERFLNPHRTSPPDFDIDFSWMDRDEVIDFVFRRYGSEHVVLLGSVSTFQAKQTIRELGKVFGLPKEEIDRIAEGSFIPTDKVHRQIKRAVELLHDFPHHASIHPGGILISELPVHYYTATFTPPKGFETAQIDMFTAEEIGLYKFDVLSQRGLGHIKDTVQLVKETRNIDIAIHEVEKFKRDKRVAAQIRSADTIGCFYIESPSMRQLLKKLKCDDYKTLVAASSIIRPGVGQSGMMQEYIYRYHHPGKFSYLHPKMEELLKETFGVMVYQEDVIKVAHHYGGLDAAEADILRRAMSGKYRGKEEMRRLEVKFFGYCKGMDYPEETTKEVWRQIESFSGYSFSKAHSASFAVESYQSLYLKTYYPIEFMVAVINNQGGFYNRFVYFEQLKRAGAVVENPCVNHSGSLASISAGKVYAGLSFVKGLEAGMMGLIIKERNHRGPFGDLQDFIERTKMAVEQLNLLIKVNAFKFTGKSKGTLMWEANTLQRTNDKRVPAGQSLFGGTNITFGLPVLKDNVIKSIHQDLEFLGFTTANIFEIAEDDGRQYVAAKDIGKYEHRVVTCLAYLITTKDTYTKAGRELMHFGTWIDYNGDWLDTVHFPRTAKLYPFQRRGFYRITGRVIQEFGVYSIAVESMEKRGLKSWQEEG